MRGSEDRPKAYFFKDGRPTKQLTLEEMRFNVSTGNLKDAEVIAWLAALDGGQVFKREEYSLSETSELSDGGVDLKTEGLNAEILDGSPKAVISDGSPKAVPKNEGFAPRSPELYNYLAGLYKIKTWGNV